MDATRIISLQALREQITHKNDQTIQMNPKMFERVEFEDLLYNHYSIIQDFNQQYTDGLCIYICSGYELVGKAFLSSKDGEVNTLVLGRHSQSEVFLTKDQSLSLRHLVFMTHPKSDALMYRILDLRSRNGFENEAGQTCQSLVADGHAFIRLNHYHILCFPAQFDSLKVQDPELAWQALPPRQYVDRPEDLTNIPFTEDSSSIVSLSPPEPLRRQINGPAMASLELYAKDNYVNQPLDIQMLETGILIGRYTRCDHAFQPFLTINSISRVHSLIILIEDSCYIIDTASTNGTYLNGERIKRAMLRDRAEIYIGDKDDHYANGLKLSFKRLSS